MKRRIAVWAGLGVVAACCWLLYVLTTPQRQVALALHEPAVRALMFITCPALYAVRDIAVPFWLAAAMNASTYALIGLTVEIGRRKWSPSEAT